MLGLRFDTCNEFGLSFSFDQCQLNHSIFSETTIRRTVFKNSSLQEVDFSEADLTDVVFDHCDLTSAVFDRTTLEKADFRTSFNFSINPERNHLRKAKFSLMGLPGLLNQYGIEID